MFNNLLIKYVKFVRIVDYHAWSGGRLAEFVRGPAIMAVTWVNVRVLYEYILANGLSRDMSVTASVLWFILIMFLWFYLVPTKYSPWLRRATNLIIFYERMDAKYGIDAWVRPRGSEPSALNRAFSIIILVASLITFILALL